LPKSDPVVRAEAPVEPLIVLERRQPQVRAARSPHSSGGQRFAQFSSLRGCNCEGWQPARKAASSSATRCALTKGAGWGVCTEAVVRKGRLVGEAGFHAQVGPFGDQRQADPGLIIDCCEKQGCVLYAQHHQCAPRERHLCWSSWTQSAHCHTASSAFQALLRAFSAPQLLCASLVVERAARAPSTLRGPIFA